jgi:uncharacterized protein YbjT (DUF2867 family)
MENFLPEAGRLVQRGVLSYPMPGHVPIPMVAAADIANVALKYLVRRDWNGIDGVAVHGPEDLSYGEAAAIMGRVLARPMRYEQTSAGQYVQRMVSAGASTRYAQSLVKMHAELAQGIANAEPRTPESTTRTTLAKWSARELYPLAEPLLSEWQLQPYSMLLPLPALWPPGSPGQRVQLGV